MARVTFVLIGISAVAVAIVLSILLLRRPQDCSFTGWERTVGVGLEAQVRDLEIVKTKLGITDVQVRQYDNLMKDYALKYDAACQDVSATPPRMGPDEYACLRRNMDHVLDDVRRFVQAIEGAKSVSDATGQKEILLRALADLEDASNSSYRAGCASAMDVNPKTLSFTGLTPERSIVITNRGNRDIHFSIDDCPEGFNPRPFSGTLPKGTTAAVSFIRTVLPVPARRPLTFRVRTNFNDDVEITIETDNANLAMLNTLGERLNHDSASPTVEMALAAVDQTLQGTILPDSDRYELASATLFTIHQDAMATEALDWALATSEKSPRSSALVMRGMLAQRQREPQDALRYFDTARKVTLTQNDDTGAIVDLFSAAVRLDNGERDALDALNSPALSTTIAANPILAQFAARELCLQRTSMCSRLAGESLGGASAVDLTPSRVLKNVRLQTPEASSAGSPTAAQERSVPTWFERGNCIVVDVREGRSPLAFDESLCGRTEGSIGTNYNWLPAFLIAAFDTAEMTACRRSGCAPNELAVRVYIRGGQVPVLQESISDSKVVLVMTTALIDVVESSLTTVFQDLALGSVAQPYGSFRAWLRTVDNAAGRPCSGVPTSFAGLTRRPRTVQDFTQVRSMAQVFYRFIFAHELGHILRGTDCGAGAGAEGLTLEKRCDQLAFEWMTSSNQRMMLPPMIIVPAVGLDHYAAVLDPLLGELIYNSGDSFAGDSPAVQWGRRAGALISDWDNLCRTGRGDTATVCRAGWQGSIDDMRRLVDAPKPDGCVLSDARSGPSNLAVAMLESNDPARCLRLSELNKKSIDWVATGDPAIVKVNLQYRNRCDRPIQCKLSVLCGTVSRADPTGGRDWRPGQKKTDEFKLMPDQFYEVTQTLQWYADEERMPRVVFPRPPSEDMQYAACEFAGDTVSRPKDATWCTPITQILNAGRGKFQDIKGQLIDTTEEHDKFWSTTVRLPGATDCEINEWSDPELTPRYSCTLGKSGEAGGLEQQYADAIQQVRNCLGGGWDWNETTKDRPRSVTRESEASRERADATVSVVVRTNKTSGRSSLEVNIDSPE